LTTITSPTVSSKPVSIWKEPEIERVSQLNGEPESVLNLRKQAFSRLKSTPWPTALDEAWRRNDPRRIGIDKFPLWRIREEGIESDQALSGNNSIDFHSSKVTFHNGLITSSEILQDHSKTLLSAGDFKSGFAGKYASTVESIILNPPGDVDSPAMTLLHLAFFQGGSHCVVPDNWSSPHPVVVRHFLDHDGEALFPLNVIHIGRNSRLTLFLEHEDRSTVASWLGVINRISLEENARLDLILLNSAGETVNFTEHTTVSMKRDSHFNMTWFDNTAGWTVARREISLSGKGAEARLKGAHVGAEHSLYDLRTLQDHTAPSTFSDLMFKAVNFDKAQSVYQGLIKVSPDALNANAYQLNRNLLMSHEARADSIPKLEILVDEVKCTHGASVGKPDPNAIFYLRSRGIPEKEAARLLVEGFLGESGVLISDPHHFDRWHQLLATRYSKVFR